MDNIDYWGQLIMRLASYLGAIMGLMYILRRGSKKKKDEGVDVE